MAFRIGNGNDTDRPHLIPSLQHQSSKQYRNIDVRSTAKYCKVVCVGGKCQKMAMNKSMSLVTDKGSNM